MKNYLVAKKGERRSQTSDIRNQITEGKRKISVGRDQKEEGRKKLTKIYRMLLIRL